MNTQDRQPTADEYADRYSPAVEEYETPIEPAPPPLPAGLPQTHSLAIQVLRLSVWPLLDCLLMSLVGIVDMALAGRLYPEATDALGAVGPIAWLLNILMAGIGVGGTAIVSRATGRGDRHEATHATHQALILAIVWGSAIAVSFFILARPISAMFGLEGVALNDATRYLQLIALVTTFRAVLFIGGACFRGSGNMRLPFIVMFTVNVLNLGLSIVLVAAPAPFGGYGVTGIAIGTATAWLTGGLIMFIVTLRGSKYIDRWVGKPQVDLPMILRIVRVGLPHAIEVGLMWIGNFAIFFIVGNYLAGQYLLGAHMITIRIESFSFMPAFAFGIAASTCVGQYLGIQDPQRARKAVFWCLSFAGLLGLMFTVLFTTFPEILVRLLTDQPEIIEMAVPPVRIAGFVLVAFSTSIVLGSALHGAGDTKWAMIILIGSTFFVRLPLVLLFTMHYEMGLTGVWYGLASEMVIRALFYMMRFLHGGWKHAKV